MRLGPAVRIILALGIVSLASVAISDGADGANGPDKADKTGRTGRARVLGSFIWSIDLPWFGGWSGIELSEDGQRMTAITDRGYGLRADITREGDRITAITPRQAWRMKASTGKYLTPKIIDSEGLALAPDGSAFISFEGITRVSRYQTLGASARVLDRHRDFREFSRNKSLEALAIDHRGRLFAIPELVENGRIRVFVLAQGKWSTPFTLSGGNGFLPVGADFGPDGRFYLLERWWSVLGFRTRVRRWDISTDQPENEELLVQSGVGRHDNLEGLAIWRDTKGRTRLTMIADDNFRSFQRSEIVEYALQE